MRPKNSNSLFIILTTILLAIGSMSSFGQSETKIDFKYQVDSVKMGELYQYTITVNVTEGEGPFMIGVYENLKDDLKELDKKVNIASGEAKLVFMGKKSCIIYVTNHSQSAVKHLIYN